MSALLLFEKTNFHELGPAFFNASPDYNAIEELWNNLKKFCWNVSQSIDKGFNTATSGNDFIKYFEETKQEGSIFKFAGISSSMEAFFSNQCSNADKEICEGPFFARPEDKELFDSLHQLLGDG